MLVKGEASCLSAPLSPDSWNSLRKGQRMTLETSTNGFVDIRLARGGKQERVTGSTIPVGWREAAQVATTAPGVYVVLGDVDSGKSTLSAFLANESLHQGRTVSIVDGDVGQSDLGPPTTISTAKLTSEVSSLQQLKSETTLFIGDTSPATITDKVRKGLVQLRDIAKQHSELVIINTDGWIMGDEAFRYKQQLLDALQPDLVIGIDVEGELAKLLDLPSSTVLKLSRSKFARIRSREERKHTRDYGYQRFLNNASPMRIPLSDVKLRRYDSFYQMKLRERENFRGLVAGLLDEKDHLQSLARIEGLTNNVLKLWTVKKDSPSTVELGSVVLSSKYAEMGFDG